MALPDGLGALLRALQEAGLVIGVAEHLRLHQVFAAVPTLGPDPDQRYRRLAAILRAILVHNEGDRTTFERVFDAWLEATRVAMAPAIAPRPEPPIGRRETDTPSRTKAQHSDQRRLGLVAAVLAVVIALTSGAVWLIHHGSTPIEPPPAPPTSEPQPPEPDLAKLTPDAWRQRRSTAQVPTLQVEAGATRWTGWPVLGLVLATLAAAAWIILGPGTRRPCRHPTGADPIACPSPCRRARARVCSTGASRKCWFGASAASPPRSRPGGSTSPPPCAPPRAAPASPPRSSPVSPPTGRCGCGSTMPPTTRSSSASPRRSPPPWAATACPWSSPGSAACRTGWSARAVRCSPRARWTSAATSPPWPSSPTGGCSPAAAPSPWIAWASTPPCASSPTGRGWPSSASARSARRWSPCCAGTRSSASGRRTWPGSWVPTPPPAPGRRDRHRRRPSPIFECGRRPSSTRWVSAAPRWPTLWGLHDMHGNAWEWVEDCWHESYAGAPADGSAWVAGECTRRVLRGGAFGFVPWFLRSAFRGRGDPMGRVEYVGLRCARAARRQPRSGGRV